MGIGTIIDNPALSACGPAQAGRWAEDENHPANWEKY